MRIALLVVLGLLLFGCRTESGGDIGTSRSPFTSQGATLVDFAFDGRIGVGDDDGETIASANNSGLLRRLIEAQLMYATIGQLNGARSVGRHERLVISNIVAVSDTEATYHAELPVAWGGGAPPQQQGYELIMPRKVSTSEQRRFAERYAPACSDPEGGVDIEGAGRLFLFFRPMRAGCALDEADIVRAHATVKPSTENTRGRYPEYHRVWEDGALHAVAVFGREFEEREAGAEEEDGGKAAYRDFVRDMRQLLHLPNAALGQQLESSVHLEAELPGRRKVVVDAILIAPRVSSVDDDAGAPFDGWYAARTGDADLIVYSGHAGLGENVRALMTKGSFRPKQYAVWLVNGCDTFAYLDRTLVNRRAELNPDDPSGAKYMDTVSNVLGGYFRTGDETARHFLEAMLDAGDPTATPRTFEEIFARIDPSQIIVVTGEEDNELHPVGMGMGMGMGEATPPSERSPKNSGGPTLPITNGGSDPSVANLGGGGGCDVSRRRTTSAPPPIVLVVGFVVMLLTCPRRLRRSRLVGRSTGR
jgi:hypothetical protein